MKDFVAAHDSNIKGVLSCFDRMLFRGYLPIQDGASVDSLLDQNNIRFRNLNGRRRPEFDSELCRVASSSKTGS